MGFPQIFSQAVVCLLLIESLMVRCPICQFINLGNVLLALHVTPKSYKYFPVYLSKSILYLSVTLDFLQYLLLLFYRF